MRVRVVSRLLLGIGPTLSLPVPLSSAHRPFLWAFLATRTTTSWVTSFWPSSSSSATHTGRFIHPTGFACTTLAVGVGATFHKQNDRNCPLPAVRSSHSLSASPVSKKSLSLSTQNEQDINNMVHVLVPIADGSEEIETTCITDTLTRFGAKVTVASVMPNGRLLCRMSRGIHIQADCTIAQAAAATHGWDLIALPGGMPGAEHLRDCATLIDLLKQQQQQQQSVSGKYYAAVCASPAVVFATHDLLDPQQLAASATCYPAPKFRDALGVMASNELVVVAGNLITSQGPGTSLQFALQLGQLLFGKEKRDEIANQLLVE